MEQQVEQLLEEKVDQQFLDKLLTKVAEQSERATSMFTGLNGGQINWKPSPEVWSAGECLEHIIQLFDVYRSKVNRAFDPDIKYSFWEQFSPLQDFIGRTFVNASKPESKRKVKTYKDFVPQKSHLRIDVLDRFIKHQGELGDLIEKSKNYDLYKIKVTSPVSTFITFKLKDFLELLVVHVDRHLLQAERLMQMEGFPK